MSQVPKWIESPWSDVQGAFGDSLPWHFYLCNRLGHRLWPFDSKSLGFNGPEYTKRIEDGVAKYVWDASLQPSSYQNDQYDNNCPTKTRQNPGPNRTENIERTDLEAGLRLATCIGRNSSCKWHWAWMDLRLRCIVLCMSCFSYSFPFNVGNTIIHHPPNEHKIGWHKPFPNGWFIVLPTLLGLPWRWHSPT